MVERFNRTLVEEFYQIVMIKKKYSYLAEIDTHAFTGLGIYLFI